MDDLTAINEKLEAIESLLLENVAPKQTLDERLAKAREYYEWLAEHPEHQRPKGKIRRAWRSLFDGWTKKDTVGVFLSAVSAVLSSLLTLKLLGII